MPRPTEPPPSGATLPLAGDHLWMARRAGTLHPLPDWPPEAGPQPPTTALPDGPPVVRIGRCPDETATPPPEVEPVSLAELIGGMHPVEPAALPARLAAWVNTL